jgi:hypothetical protein
MVAHNSTKSMANIGRILNSNSIQLKTSQNAKKKPSDCLKLPKLALGLIECGTCL